MQGTNAPAAERKHIAFFGVRNAGKSSLVNAVTGQELSLVSDVRGTTTDPVIKSMELLPAGPVVIIDTPGIDDGGPLGEQRVARAKETLRRTDLAVLVVSAETGLTQADRDLIGLFTERGIPYVIALHKADLLQGRSISAQDADRTGKDEAGLVGGVSQSAVSDTEDKQGLIDQTSQNDFRAPGNVRTIRTSAVTGEGIRELKEAIAGLLARSKEENPFVADLVRAGDLVVLVTPIDEAAPKGRLILPQQMVLRALLDADAIPVVTKETTYAQTLASLQMAPALVITDSQVFAQIDRQTPDAIPLTSFSILMARYRGTLTQAVRAAEMLDRIKDGAKILISEGCTHHRQCNDIGTVKLPEMIRRHSGSAPDFSFSSGRSFPEDLAGKDLVVHCGGCMLNEREMQSRAAEAEAAAVPMTNYGIAIAKMNGILARSIRMLPELAR